MVGSTVKRTVREQLELQFDTYLGQVVSYLKEGYRELALSPELIEEIAATVIVRVSHSNPEPENLEQALLTSADDLVRARRPRLSQQKLLDRMNGVSQSELPASLPSLRLIQRLSRVPASNTDDVAGDALVGLGRLSLPKPPVDLQASLNAMGFHGAKELEGASIPSAQIPSLQHEPRPRPVVPAYDDALDELTGMRERSPVNEPGELERELDEQLTGTVLIPKIQFLPDESEDPADAAPIGVRQPSILGLPEALESQQVESSKKNFELPAKALAPPNVPTESTMAGARAEPVGAKELPSTSSVPPTKESIAPTALAEMPRLFQGASAPAEDTSGVLPEATDLPASKPRRASSKHKPTAAARKKTGKTVVKKHTRVASPEHVVQSFGILPDELSMLSMVGFPDNPKRAARLCVASLADELGISSNDGFASLAEAVTRELETLRREYEATGQVGSRAALQWQRVARQATLRAFLNR